MKNSQVIIGSVIIGFFLASAILTVAFGTDEEEKKSTAKDTEQIDDIPKSLEEYEKKYGPLSDVQKSQSNEEEPTPQKPVIKHNVLDKDPIEKLNSLIGLEDVKAEVKSLTNQVKLQKEREARGMKNAQITYHCVFSGNPGTGKTTVARILARIYKDLGVLQYGHLVETDRSGLIGEYVGQTGPKVKHMVDSAMGGVLFIDEAYALMDGKNGYGAEAIATLLKEMEDHRDSLVVIVAGYNDEMKRFVDSNPGLQSRFTRYINFPDYTAEELYGIYMLSVKDYDYVLDDEASNYLKQCFAQAIQNKTRYFGNGRYARNLFELSTTFQANRLASMDSYTDEQIRLITKDDISKAFKQVKQ